MKTPSYSNEAREHFRAINSLGRPKHITIPDRTYGEKVCKCGTHFVKTMFNQTLCPDCREKKVLARLKWV